MSLTFGSLFAGIGGFDLGLERAGMECKWQVEIDDYATRVLEKHWPTVKRWRDVRSFPPEAGVENVDVIVGGFPCQDISVAGNREGINGQRSGLWGEFSRIIRVLLPRYVVIENSSELVNNGLDAILCDLAASGYDAEWQPVKASDFALPHSRKRTFVVAYTNKITRSKGVGHLENGKRAIFSARHIKRDAIRIQTAHSPNRMADGVSGRSYRNRVEGLGNAVVPQVAQWIGERIIEHSNLNNR